jgi:hypothetical protein
MPQYLPFIPDTFPEAVVYAPDFNFFDKMLQRKQALYEAGVSKAKYAYSSVHDAPLSDKANIPLRDQYIKQAEDGLKKISATDLSLPENQQAAESLYSPFWEDDLINQDTRLTRWYQEQGQKLANMRDSSDPKVREQYNGIAMKYISNGLDVLQNANRDASKYAKVEKREAVPFRNVPAYLDDEAKKEELKIVWDEQSPDGAYFVSTTNGQKSEKKFSTWAQSKVGNNFYDQYHVTGIVEKEERARQIKKLNPNWNEEQIGKYMAQDVVDELTKGYTKRKADVNAEIARLDGMLEALPETMTARDKELADRITDEKTKLYGNLSMIDEEYKGFDATKKQTILDNVYGNPDGYFAQLAKQREIGNWAVGRASIESKEIKPNTAWSSAQTLNMQRITENRQEREFQHKVSEDMYYRTHAKPGTKGGGTITVKDANGNDIQIPIDGGESSIDPLSTGIYTGYGSTDVTKNEATAADLFNKTQDGLYLSAHDQIFDSNGILTLATNLGMSRQEVVSVSTALKQDVRTKYASPNASYTFTKEQKAATDKLKTALSTNEAVKASGIKLETTEGLRDAINVYTLDYYSKRKQLTDDGHYIPMTKEERSVLRNYTIAKSKLDTYQGNEENRKQLIEKNILSNPEKYGTITTIRHGKKDLIGVDDIAKELKNIELNIPGELNSSPVKMSKEELARKYMAGELIQTEGGDLFFDGKKYSIASINGKSTGWGADTRAYNKMIHDLEASHGMSEDFSKLIKEAQHTIIPNLLYYQQRSGKMGAQFDYVFDTKHNMSEDKSARIFNAAIGNADNGVLYEADGVTQLAPTTAEKLRGLLSDEQGMEKYVGKFTYKTQGVDGQPTLQFTIKDQPSETKGFDIDDIKTRTFNIKIQPTAASPDLNDLPNSTGMYIYGKLLRGEPIKSDPILAASGFDYELTPDADPSGNTQGVHLDLKYNLRVNSVDAQGHPKTELKPMTEHRFFNMLQGENRKNPDEIMSYLDSLYLEIMDANGNKENEYQTAVKTNPNVVTYNKSDYFKEKGIVINKK